jgi:hypothetical protein
MSINGSGAERGQKIGPSLKRCERLESWWHFCTLEAAVAFRRLTTPNVFEAAMKESLSPQQEADAQQLADRIVEASRDDILRLARLLVAAGPSPFGEPERAARDTALTIGARALEQALAQKKTATTAAASPAPAATRPPPTTPTAAAPW